MTASRDSLLDELREIVEKNRAQIISLEDQLRDVRVENAHLKSAIAYKNAFDAMSVRDKEIAGLEAEMWAARARALEAEVEIEYLTKNRDDWKYACEAAWEKGRESSDDD